MKSPRPTVVVRPLAVALVSGALLLGSFASGAFASDASPTPDMQDGDIVSTLVDANPELTYDAMIWQAYWLSRDHFGPFVVGTGMGQSFQPPRTLVESAIKAVAPSPDAVEVPANLAPLEAVYASGSPELVNDPTEYPGRDFMKFRLDAETFDTTIPVRGQAQTMLKESQWARNFASLHFGQVNAEQGAQQRFTGMMILAFAKRQGAFAMENLRGDDGLYRDSDGTLDHQGNWEMLQAFADIAGVTAESGSRYEDTDASAMFQNASNELLEALSEHTPATAPEAASAVRALTYFAWTTSDDAMREAALDRARSIADEQLVPAEPDEVVDAFAAITGLATAAMTLGDDRYLEHARELLDRWRDDFDPEHGVFRGRTTYTPADVAWIIGGLNLLTMNVEGEPATSEPGRMLHAFYEATINQSGMQLSAPEGKNGAMASDWEKELPGVIYYHPIDTPTIAQSRLLPVPAAEVEWMGDEWRITDNTFVVAGAMRLANEINWMGPHLGSVPVPPIGSSE